MEEEAGGSGRQGAWAGREAVAFTPFPIAQGRGGVLVHRRHAARQVAYSWVHVDELVPMPHHGLCVRVTTLPFFSASLKSGREPLTESSIVWEGRHWHLVSLLDPSQLADIVSTLQAATRVAAPAVLESMRLSPVIESVLWGGTWCLSLRQTSLKVQGRLQLPGIGARGGSFVSSPHLRCSWGQVEAADGELGGLTACWG